VTAEILALYARVRWLLFRRGLKGALAGLRKPPRRTRPAASAGELADSTARVLRFLPAGRGRIVPSLVLSGLLARRGLESKVVVGVDPGPELAAQAWVEHGGVPLLGAGELHRFMEL
jgi:hypothetical protein